MFTIDDVTKSERFLWYTMRNYIDLATEDLVKMYNCWVKDESNEVAGLQTSLPKDAQDKVIHDMREKMAKKYEAKQSHGAKLNAYHERMLYNSAMDRACKVISDEWVDVEKVRKFLGKETSSTDVPFEKVDTPAIS